MSYGSQRHRRTGHGPSLCRRGPGGERDEAIGGTMDQRTRAFRLPGGLRGRVALQRKDRAIHAQHASARRAVARVGPVLPSAFSPPEADRLRRVRRPLRRRNAPNALCVRNAKRGEQCFRLRRTKRCVRTRWCIRSACKRVARSVSKTKAPIRDSNTHRVRLHSAPASPGTQIPGVFKPRARTVHFDSKPEHPPRSIARKNANISIVWFEEPRDLDTWAWAGENANKTMRRPTTCPCLRGRGGR